LARKYQSVLVTGGAGFIGSHLADRLLVEGYKVRVLDNLSTGTLQNIAGHLGRGGFRFVKGDIMDAVKVRRVLRGVKVVFHEAALTSVPDSVADPLPTNEVNATGTLKLLKASAQLGVRRLIYASSSSVYGEQTKQPIKEDSLPRPMSPYAASKLAGENYCSTFSRLGQLETVCLRYFNVYGPRQGRGPYSGVIRIFQDRLRGNKPPIIYGDGRQTRDFVSVLDVVQANMLAMRVKEAAGEVYNIGSGVKTSINMLAEMTTEASGKINMRPVHAPARPGDIRHSCADIAKACRILGYSPSFTLRRYILETIGMKGRP